MGELVVTVDIGTSKICALCGRQDKSGQTEILAKATVPCSGMRKGQITDIESVARSINEALKTIETSAAVRIGSAYINLLGLHVDVLTNKVSVIAQNQGHETSREDVDELFRRVKSLQMPVDTEIIDVIPRQFIVDGGGGIKDPVGMVGVNLELEADIVTGKFASITNIIKCIETAGIKIDGLIISGQALGEAILSKEEKDMGVILIDVGGSVTDLSVFKNGRLFFYDSLLVGGDHVTSDVSIAMKIPYQDAERIKRECALALTSLLRKDQELYVNDINDNSRRLVYISEIIEVIEARVYEILSMCRDILNENSVEFNFEAGVVLTGGGISYLGGNRQIAAEVFGLPVKVFPVNTYEIQKSESALAEGMLKYVISTSRGGRYGSTVQILKSSRGGAGGDGIFRRFIEILKRLF